METMERIHRVSEYSTPMRRGGIGSVVRIFVARRPRAALIIFLVIVGLVVLAYTKFDGISPEERAQKELAAAVAAVGELMILPEGDEPVLATVTDAEALTAQQAFFTGAIDGDQLLLFPKSLKAIIYSPSRDKIINAGPIEQSPSSAEASAGKPATNGAAVKQSSAATSPSADMLTVEVRNGTGKTGYASQFAQELGANAGYKIVKVDDAVKKDYQHTVVYVRTGDESNQSKIDALTTSLGVAAIDSLPDGEKTTSAGVLVILGGD